MNQHRLSQMKIDLNRKINFKTGIIGTCQRFKPLAPKWTCQLRWFKMWVSVVALYAAQACGTSQVLVIWPMSLYFAEDLNDFIGHYGFARIILYLSVRRDGEASGKSYSKPYSGVVYCSENWMKPGVSGGARQKHAFLLLLK